MNVEVSVSLLVLIGTVFTGLIGLIWALVMERVRNLEGWRRSVDVNIPARVETLETWRAEIDMNFWPVKTQVAELTKTTEQLERDVRRAGGRPRG